MALLFGIGNVDLSFLAHAINSAYRDEQSRK